MAAHDLADRRLPRTPAIARPNRPHSPHLPSRLRICNHQRRPRPPVRIALLRSTSPRLSSPMSLRSSWRSVAERLDGPPADWRTRACRRLRRSGGNACHWRRVAQAAWPSDAAIVSLPSRRTLIAQPPQSHDQLLSASVSPCCPVPKMAVPSAMTDHWWPARARGDPLGRW